MAVMVEGRDGNLRSLGPVVWSKVDLTPRYNAVGAWTITLPSTPANWKLADTPDLGITVDWNGVYKFSGYLETWNPSKSIDDNGVPTETITLSGADDLGLVANRLAFPNPAAVWASQTAGAADSQTGKLETVIKHYVNVNAGPGAIATRRAPHLTVAADVARGGTVAYLARLADGTDLPLMDIIRKLVATGGPLGVSVVQNGTSLVFDTYVPADRTDTAWFSYEAGGLRSYNLSDSAPTCTNALVRGSTTFIEVTGAGHDDAWKYVEQLVDQASSTDATEMTQAGQDAVVQGAGAASLAVTTIDLPHRSFGVDYNLGDQVTIEIREGVTYPDIVSAVQLVADATSQTYTETVTPTIGASDQDIGDDPTVTARLAAKVRELERQIKRIQAG